MNSQVRVGGLAPAQVAAAVGLLIVAMGAVMLLQRHHLAATSAPALSTTPAATPLLAVPSEDLAAANLGGGTNLVTPFRMVANDGTAKTLIGAYADTTRTVLFFRSPGGVAGAAAAAVISIYDSHGFLNGSTIGGRGIAGDWFYGIDLGPRPAQDGLAHLTVTDTGPQESFTAPPPSTGWAYRFTLKVHAVTALAAPATLALGSWKVTIENLAATPSVIDFQAVVAGANPDQLSRGMQSQPVTLLDASGNEVQTITATSGITVPKQQLDPTNYQNTRVHYQWARPETAATYQLRISGNGAMQTITLHIPAA